MSLCHKSVIFSEKESKYHLTCFLGAVPQAGVMPPGLPGMMPGMVMPMQRPLVPGMPPQAMAMNPSAPPQMMPGGPQIPGMVMQAF